MGVISTPPMPAAASCSSCRVRLALSTPLPGHHQRVHGLFSRVREGHAADVTEAGASSALRAEIVNRRTATMTRRRGERIGTQVAAQACGDNGRTCRTVCETGNPSVLLD